MKKVAILMASLILAMAVLGCAAPAADAQGTQGSAAPSAGAEPAASEAKYKDTIVVGRAEDGTALDDYFSIDSATLEVNFNIYDQLTTIDNDGNVLPSLATEWNWDNETDFIIKLRDDVLFHNGDKMTAEDVKFSWERAKASVAQQNLVGTFDHAEVIDDYTVKFVYTSTYAPAIPSLSLVSIVSKAYVEEVGQDVSGTNPVGTGAYKFVSWTLNDSVVLEAFPDYWKGEAKTKNLIFRVIPESSQMTIALENGEIDVACGISSTDIETIKSHSNLEVVSVAATRIEYVGMSQRIEPFQDLRVRQAVAYAIDVDTMINSILGETGTPAYNPCAPGLFGYVSDSEVTTYGYDPEKAKALLAEAGYPNGFTTKLWVRDSSPHTEIATAIQSYLSAVGIKVEVEILEFAALLERTGNFEHEMFMMGWGNSTGDASNSMYGLFSETNLGVSGNRSDYTSADNAHMQELLEAQRSEMDSDTRAKMFLEIQQGVTADCVLVPLYYQNEVVGRSTNVQNMIVNNCGQGLHIYWGVSIIDPS